MTASRVLVVDDEKLIRWTLSERLSRNGCDVVSAESGEEALHQLAQSAFDAMLLDIRLPGIDGVETLRRALLAQPQLAVILMSAHGTIAIAVEGMKHGAFDFLVKPFPFATLDAAVKRAIDAAATRRAATGLDCEDEDECHGACLVGISPAIELVREMAKRVAASDSTVLIEGESGAGKEVVARCIRARSARRKGPFISVNCAALPEHLLESERFGHERGAFTDARSQKVGIFEAAAGGTVMLDEIGDMPAAGQAKLLRLLEERTFRRVGGVQEIGTDVRVIAATNVDLERRVADEEFRADLFFRLNVVRIRVPPLRERTSDLPALSAHFIGRYNSQFKRSVRGISLRALELLQAYPWPGNVREGFRNTIERAFILHADMDEIRPEHLPTSMQATPSVPALPPVLKHVPVVPLAAMERQLIVDALRRANGNQSEAARLLDVTRDTLRYRIKKHALEAS